MANLGQHNKDLEAQLKKSSVQLLNKEEKIQSFQKLEKQLETHENLKSSFQELQQKAMEKENNLIAKCASLQSDFDQESISKDQLIKELRKEMRV